MDKWAYACILGVTTLFACKEYQNHQVLQCYLPAGSKDSSLFLVSTRSDAAPDSCWITKTLHSDHSHTKITFTIREKRKTSVLSIHFTPEEFSILADSSIHEPNSNQMPRVGGKPYRRPMSSVFEKPAMSLVDGRYYWKQNSGFWWPHTYRIFFYWEGDYLVLEINYLFKVNEFTDYYFHKQKGLTQIKHGLSTVNTTYTRAE